MCLTHAPRADPDFKVAQVNYDTTTEMQWYTGSTGSMIVLAFRGSGDSEVAWNSNFNSALVTYPGVPGACSQRMHASWWRCMTCDTTASLTSSSLSTADHAYTPTHTT